MTNPDIIYKELRKRYESGENIDWVDAGDKLAKKIPSEIKFTEKKFILNKIEKYFGQKRGIRILDFGCGGGAIGPVSPYDGIWKGFWC